MNAFDFADEPTPRRTRHSGEAGSVFSGALAVCLGLCLFVVVSFVCYLAYDLATDSGRQRIRQEQREAERQRVNELERLKEQNERTLEALKRGR